MGCCGGPQGYIYAKINGELVSLKGIKGIFDYFRSTGGLRPDSPDLGDTLVKAVREAGNDIPVEMEQAYATGLKDLFAFYCKTGLFCAGTEE
ncbi:MAG: hypothetical protein CXZ00_01925 [Acidobacteria bacterium]|nr:MAG: hypothetical protein CXZ00_01925 [Acidobacteriota bacterium]